MKTYLKVMVGGSVPAMLLGGALLADEQAAPAGSGATSQPATRPATQPATTRATQPAPDVPRATRGLRG